MAKHPLKPCYPPEDGPGLTVKCPPHTPPLGRRWRGTRLGYSTHGHCAHPVPELLPHALWQSTRGGVRLSRRRLRRGNQPGPWGVMSAPSCVKAGAVEARWETAQWRKPGRWQGSHGAGARPPALGPQRQKKNHTRLGHGILTRHRLPGHHPDHWPTTPMKKLCLGTVISPTNPKACWRQNSTPHLSKSKVLANDSHGTTVQTGSITV